VRLGEGGEGSGPGEIGADSARDGRIDQASGGAHAPILTALPLECAVSSVPAASVTSWTILDIAHIALTRTQRTLEHA